MTRVPYQLIVLLLLSAMAAAAHAETFPALVVAVLDGDTIDIFSAREQEIIRVRFYGIDCPEKDQPHGSEATKMASFLAFSKDVTIRTRGRGVGKFGRTIADVILPDGRTLNHELVKAGACWWFRRYALGDETLAELEAEARMAKRGLWADLNPIPPWEWRHRSK